MASKPNLRVVDNDDEIAKWAVKISAAWQETVSGIIAVGRALIEAREALKGRRGTWSELINANDRSRETQKLPFGAATAVMLVKIAEDDRISNHGNIMPPSWRTLYELTQLSDAKFKKAIEDGSINPEMERSDAAALRGGASQLIQQSLSNEHYTPARYIEAARMVLGEIDLDPASCKKANEIVKAKEFFHEKNDGLTKEWNGRVWMNPPYGDLVGKFVEKMMGEIKVGNVDAAIVLVNAHCTDTIWFQPLWEGCLCFTDHRIDFSGDDKRSGSTHGSVFIYFGNQKFLFADTFGQFGAIVRRWRYE